MVLLAACTGQAPGAPAAANEPGVTQPNAPVTPTNPDATGIQQAPNVSAVPTQPAPATVNNTTGVSTAPAAALNNTTQAPMAATVNIINVPGPEAAGGGLYGGVFSPRDITVSVGATVTWNDIDSAHGTHHVICTSLFSNTMKFGDSFSYTFTQAGTFNYYDDLYDNLDGTIVVVGNGAK
jgi:plastocyanin